MQQNIYSCNLYTVLRIKGTLKQIGLGKLLLTIPPQRNSGLNCNVTLYSDDCEYTPNHISESDDGIEFIFESYCYINMVGLRLLVSNKKSQHCELGLKDNKKYRYRGILTNLASRDSLGTFYEKLLKPYN